MPQKGWQLGWWPHAHAKVMPVRTPVRTLVVGTTVGLHQMWIPSYIWPCRQDPPWHAGQVDHINTFMKQPGISNHLKSLHGDLLRCWWSLPWLTAHWLSPSSMWASYPWQERQQCPEDCASCLPGNAWDQTWATAWGRTGRLEKQPQWA